MGKIRREKPRGRLKAVFGENPYPAPRRGLERTRKPVFMGVWGLCRKPKCPRPPVTHLPLESGDCFRWGDVLYLKSKALVLAGAYALLYVVAWCVI